MKNTLLFLCLLILSSMIFSCENKERTLVQPTLDAQAFKSSPEYKTFKIALQELREAQLSGEVSFNGVSREKLAELRKDVKTVEDYVQALQAAGVKGGETYAHLVVQSSKASRALIQKFPAVKNISKAELNELMKSEQFEEIPLPDVYLKNRK